MAPAAFTVRRAGFVSRVDRQPRSVLEASARWEANCRHEALDSGTESNLRLVSATMTANRSAAAGSQVSADTLPSVAIDWEGVQSRGLLQMGKDVPPQPQNADNLVSSLARNEVHLAHASVPAGNRMGEVEKFKPRYFLGPLNRANVLSSSSLVWPTARRRMYTTIEMIMTAVAIGMWIGPRSVFIAFVVVKLVWDLTC